MDNHDGDVVNVVVGKESTKIFYFLFLSFSFVFSFVSFLRFLFYIIYKKTKRWKMKKGDQEFWFCEKMKKNGPIEP